MSDPKQPAAWKSKQPSSPEDWEGFFDQQGEQVSADERQVYRAEGQRAVSRLVKKVELDKARQVAKNLKLERKDWRKIFEAALRMLNLNLAIEIAREGKLDKEDWLRVVRLGVRWGWSPVRVVGLVEGEGLVLAAGDWKGITIELVKYNTEGTGYLDARRLNRILEIAQRGGVSPRMAQRILGLGIAQGVLADDLLEVIKKRGVRLDRAGWLGLIEQYFLNQQPLQGLKLAEAGGLNNRCQLQLMLRAHRMTRVEPKRFELLINKLWAEDKRSLSKRVWREIILGGLSPQAKWSAAEVRGMIKWAGQKEISWVEQDWRQVDAVCYSHRGHTLRDRGWEEDLTISINEGGW